MTTEETNSAIRNVLLRILNEDGDIKPDRVIEEAKQLESPLHDCFEWDIKKAALEAWRSRARQIISSFTVTLIVNRTEYRVSEFVENPIKSPKDQGYVSFEMVKKDAAMTSALFDRELAIADTYVRKAQTYAGALGLSRKVQAIIHKIQSVRESTRSKRAA